MKRRITALLCCALLCGMLTAALGEAPALDINASISADEIASLEDPSSEIAIDDLPLLIDNDPFALDDDLGEDLVVPEEEAPQEEETPEAQEISAWMQPSLKFCIDREPCNIDSDTFPDALFRAYVQQQFDANGDGRLNYEWEESLHGQITSFTGEAASVQTIKGLPRGIKSLKGIEYFPFLQSLDCSGLKLTSLDLSNNPCLQTLDCSNNQLYALIFGAQDHVDLKAIHCQDNELASLDLTGQLTFQKWLDDHIAQMQMSGDYCICEEKKEIGLRIDKGVRLILPHPEPVLSQSDCTICAGEVLQKVFVPKSPYNQSKYVYISVEGLKGRTYVQDNGLWGITFSKKGSAVVTITTKYGESVSLNVTVLSAKPIFTAKRYILGVGEKTASIIDDEQGPSAKKCTLESSDAKVVAIGSYGFMKGLKVGTATITATAPSGAKATCKVTVKAAPTAIALSPARKTISPGQQIKLQWTLSPKGAMNRVTFSSSDESVATVDESGNVTANMKGTATITARTYNGRKASCKISVQGKHRALLIGQADYAGTESDLNAPRTDADSIAAMLKGLTDDYTCTTKYDLRAVDIGKAIDSAFKDATEDDVSLFFYSGHGCGDNLSSPKNGALVGVDMELFLTRDLAEHLNAVKGRVIVLIDACRSGAFIQKNNSASGSPDPNAFNQAIIDALIGSTDAPSSNSGELRKSKYIVITACRADQNSVETKFSGNNYYQGLFTTVLLDGMGCSYLKGKYYGSMPADKNRDGNITPAELVTYIKTTIKEWTAGNNNIDQTAQYYYIDGNEVMFSRN